ncbi:MAG: hypothetical protein WD467_01885 [Candidatus Saccharimonadales bacterium]
MQRPTDSQYELHSTHKLPNGRCKVLFRHSGGGLNSATLRGLASQADGSTIARVDIGPNQGRFVKIFLHDGKKIIDFAPAVPAPEPELVKAR